MPPIVFQAPDTWDTLLRQIKQELTYPLDSYFYKKLLRLWACSKTDFRLVQKRLKEKDIPFHTFGFSQEREIKVVVRGTLHNIPQQHTGGIRNLRLYSNCLHFPSGL